MNIKHVSASAIGKYLTCPARWVDAYDEATKANDRSAASDAGILVHGAMEIWRGDPEAYPATLAGLRLAFESFAATEGLAESFVVYKRGVELLSNAYAMSTAHPILPVAMSTTLGTEVELLDANNETWKPAGVELPMKGSIDRLIALTPNAAEPKRIVLIAEDYKTGRPKSKEELLEDDVQPAIYFWWLSEVMRPIMESRGYEVLGCGLVWTYITGTPVAMYEEDFDLDLVRAYIGGLVSQMVSLAKAYNATESDQRADFLAKRERVGPGCSWCPRKPSCRNFGRAVVAERTIDLINADWSAILGERERLATMARFGEDGRKKIDELICAHIESENLDAITYGEREAYVSSAIQTSHDMNAVVEILGADFLARAGDITKKAVDAELARIASDDAERSAKMREALESRMSSRNGPRIVRTRSLARKPSAKKGKT